MKANWDDMSEWLQAKVLAYHQLCEHDEVEAENAKLKAMIPKSTTRRK